MRHGDGGRQLVYRVTRDRTYLHNHTQQIVDTTWRLVQVWQPEAVRHPSPHYRIEALARADKWYLGGLDGVLWAPPLPHRPDRPGFWDPVHLLHYEVGPCFSVALVDAEGEETRLSAGASLHRTDGAPPHDLASPHHTQPMARRWRPGSLVAEWRTNGNGVATETRQVLPGGTLESSWTLPSEVGSGCLVAFTAQPAGSVSDVRVSDGGVKWLRKVTDRTGRELAVGTEILASRPPAWRRVIPSEGGATPVWGLSPFAEGGIDGIDGLPPDDDIVVPLPSDDIGWIWIAVAFPLSMDDRNPLALRMQLSPRLARPVWPSADTSGGPTTWPSFFASFPSFSSGDPHLDRYFDYRVYGLGLNRIEGRWGNIRHPAIAEGPEYFHVPITYSAQCHMMEMRWRAGGREAWGSLLNFLDNQKDDGSLHGRLYPNHLERTDFYHANWGDALLAVQQMHPDPAVLARCYDGLSRYAHWLNRSRDPEGSGMFTVVNHFETGQEYMSRYMAVDTEADTRGWQPRLRLKGIDVTVYAHQLFRALATIARELERTGDEAEWLSLATRSGDAITRHMWSAEARLFTDVDGRTLAQANGGDHTARSAGDQRHSPARTNVKAAVGFYPMLTDLVDDARLDAMMDHLEDPRTFGTPFPLPSSSVDDPRFSAEGIWRGKRRNCPWNGRVWPMTTSHVIEGLLRYRRRGNERAGALAADMLVRFVRMMFTDGDPGRPNCFEHYNPYTGRACHFRGIDDYQHSWVLDLLARGIAGLHIDEEGVEVWPLPHELPRVALGPVRTRGRVVSVEVDEGRVWIEVDGVRCEGSRDRPLRVGWGEVGG